MTAHQISRRTILRTGAVGAAGVGASVVIAACSSSSDNNAAATTGVATSATDTSAAATSAADPSGSTDSSAAATSAAETSAAAPSGTKVAALSDITVGGSISATLDGSPIVVTQTAAGTVAAFSAICPHQGCTVAPAKTEFDCPCHGSTFNAATGARLGGPAQSGLTKLKASVADGSVYVSKS